MDWKKNYSAFMWLWILLSQAWLVIQIQSTYSTHVVSGLSLPSYIVYCVGCGIWIIYALFILDPRNYIIAVNSGMSGILSLLIVIAILIW